MIRFACPSCSATYTVGDEKGGKSGRCPKCQAQFTIPMPDSSAGVQAPTPSAPTLPSAPAQSPPPPPPPASGPVEIAPCPGCQAKLSVERGDLGSDVECPYCKTVFKAKMPGSGGGSSGSGTTGGGSTRRPKRQDEDEDVLSGIPKGGSLRGGDDDDERPSRRSRTRDDDEEEERPSRRSRRDEDDEEEERPRRRRSGGGGSDNPVFGILSLVAGILGIVMACCCGIFGWLAIPFDLAAIVLGIIGMKKNSGKGMALAGLICGIVALVVLAAVLILNVGLNVFGGAGGFQQNNQRFGR